MSLPKSYTHYINRFEKIQEQAMQLLSPVPNDKFMAKPAEGGWSAAECINHLIETGETYFQKIQYGLDNTPSPPQTSLSDGMKIRWHFRLFVKYLEPPVSVKTKAPRLFQPKQEPGIDKEQLLQQFSELQNRYLKVLKEGQSKELNLAGIHTKNPVVPFVTMSVAECIAVTEAHQRRHLEQAARVLDLTF